jgi:hypothetical protein
MEGEDVKEGGHPPSSEPEDATSSSTLKRGHELMEKLHSQLREYHAMYPNVAREEERPFHFLTGYAPNQPVHEPLLMPPLAKIFSTGDPGESQVDVAGRVLQFLLSLPPGDEDEVAVELDFGTKNVAYACVDPQVATQGEKREEG